jgi:hypothetical protein
VATCQALTLKGVRCKAQAKKHKNVCRGHDQDPAAIAARRDASRRGGLGRRPKPQPLPLLAFSDFADTSKRAHVFATLKYQVYLGVVDPKQANAIAGLDAREHGDDDRISRETLERMEQARQNEAKPAQPAFDLDLPSRFKEEEGPEAKAEREQAEVKAGGEKKPEE